MRHAAPKAHKGLGAKSLTNSLFASRTGSHSAQGMRAMNVYRARLGYGPQEGGDGTEAAGGDM